MAHAHALRYHGAACGAIERHSTFPGEHGGAPGVSQRSQSARGGRGWGGLRRRGLSGRIFPSAVAVPAVFEEEYAGAIDFYGGAVGGCGDGTALEGEQTFKAA